MNITILANVEVHEEMQNPQKIEITHWSVNYGSSMSENALIAPLEMQILGMVTSQNFAQLSILTSEIDPENFRLISRQNGLLNAKVGHGTSPTLLSGLLSSISIKH